MGTMVIPTGGGGGGSYEETFLLEFNVQVPLSDLTSKLSDEYCWYVDKPFFFGSSNNVHTGYNIIDKETLNWMLGVNSSDTTRYMFYQFGNQQQGICIRYNNGNKYLQPVYNGSNEITHRIYGVKL